LNKEVWNLEAHTLPEGECVVIRSLIYVTKSLWALLYNGYKSVERHRASSTRGKRCSDYAVYSNSATFQYLGKRVANAP
jgi:hypothetical protein